jgi:hypothetical protein
MECVECFHILQRQSAVCKRENEKLQNKRIFPGINRIFCKISAIRPVSFLEMTVMMQNAHHRKAASVFVPFRNNSPRALDRASNCWYFVEKAVKLNEF